MSEPTNDPATIVENQDAIAHLKALGFGPLLEAMEDPSCYPTHGSAAGRLSLAALARKMQLTPKAVKTMLTAAKAAFE